MSHSLGGGFESQNQKRHKLYLLLLCQMCDMNRMPLSKAGTTNYNSPLGLPDKDH